MSVGEAAFSFTAKIDGDLFTVRGSDYTEFVSNLRAVEADLGKIVGTCRTIQAAGRAAAIVAPGPQPEPIVRRSPAPPAKGPVKVPANAWDDDGDTQGADPICDCGLPANYVAAGVYKQGPKKGQSYKAFYTCPKDRNAPDKCKFYQPL